MSLISNKRQFFKPLQLVVMCIAYALLFSVGFPYWKDLSVLSHDGAATSAVVVGKEPENHQTVRYEFVVNRRTYSGQSVAGKDGIPELALLDIGDKIPVTYKIDDPAFSIGGTPNQLYKEWSILLFVLFPLISIFIGYFVFERVASFSRRRTQ